MFCPKCGTRAVAGDQRFCRECGAELSAQPAAESRQGPGASFAIPPRPYTYIRGMAKGSPLKTLLIIAGVVLLVPLALHLLFGIVVAGLVLSVALIGLAFKLLPILAVAALVYWIVMRQRRTLRHGPSR